MIYEKFTVESLETTASGSYAGYKHKDGHLVLTSNFNFKKGDVVEWWDYDGYCPSKIMVNGVVTWTQKDKQNWWDTFDSRNAAVVREKLQSMDIFNRKYNPDGKKYLYFE